MKELMCITSNQYDRDQYRNNEELQQFYHGLHCDGLEVLVLEDTAMDEILTPEDVIGVHLPFVNCWVDFWKGNQERLLEEYGSAKAGGEEWIRRFFGGITKEALTDKMRRAVQYASGYHPQYLVYHVSECTAYESVSNHYYYSDEEVLDTAIDFINTWCDTITQCFDNPPYLLLENLWHSGLNLQDPKQASRLINGIRYPRTGILLDTGHLCHCCPDIRTTDDAVDYIHHILDQMEDLSVIHGIHLHLTLSGESIKKARLASPIKGKNYRDKLEYYYPMVYEIDAHKPFISSRIPELLNRIQPDFLVYEILASSKEEYAAAIGDIK